MNSISSKKLAQLNGIEVFPDVVLFEPQASSILTSNTLLFNGEPKLIIDTGFQHGTNQLGMVKKFLNFGSNDIVFFSHYHLDHIIGSHIFPKSLKMIHESEAAALLDIETFLQFCFQFNVDQNELDQWKNRFKEFLNYEGISDWQELELSNIQSYEGKNEVDLGNFSLDIIHLPGHSPGHCGLYEQESNILFISDIDLSKFGPWYGWRSSNLGDFRRSINILKEFIYNNEIALIISSHYPPITDKLEALTRLSQFYNEIDTRQTKILDFISKNPGVTIDTIIDQSIVYSGKKSTPPFVFKTFERFHIEHHLQELEHNHKIFIDETKIYPNEKNS